MSPEQAAKLEQENVVLKARCSNQMTNLVMDAREINCYVTALERICGDKLLSREEMISEAKNALEKWRTRNGL